MSRRDWKRVEREIALRLGGRRVPVTGRSRGDAPDIQHPFLAIEVKTRTAFPALLTEAMAQADACRQPGQTPVAVVHRKGSQYGDALVCMRLRDFVDWHGPVDPEVLPDEPDEEVLR